MQKSQITSKSNNTFQLLLTKVRFPPSFGLPLQTNNHFIQLLPERSKLFDSKKKPMLVILFSSFSYYLFLLISKNK